MRNALRLFVLLSFVVSAPMLAAAQDKTAASLHIDIPVVLKQANVVFNMDHAAFEGDNPTGMNFMNQMLARFTEDKTKFNIIAVFHGEIGYMMLSDATYDKVRGTNRGNPYKGMITDLQAQGVHFEECGETMHVNSWVNAELLPGVKVNTAANLRLVELVQQGFIQIQP